MIMQKTSTILSVIIVLLSHLLWAQNHNMHPLTDDCDKIQSLLAHLEEFKGSLINGAAYECKSPYLLPDFTTARVLVPGEGKFWPVTMTSDDLQLVEAESKYLLLIQKLMKCVYLNSWKGSETIVGEGIYHYNLRQTISTSGYLKNILISYYKRNGSQLYCLELALTN